MPRSAREVSLFYVRLMESPQRQPCSASRLSAAAHTKVIMTSNSGSAMLAPGTCHVSEAAVQTSALPCCTGNGLRQTTGRVANMAEGWLHLSLWLIALRTSIRYVRESAAGGGQRHEEEADDTTVAMLAVTNPTVSATCERDQHRIQKYTGRER